jgi:UDP-N-acetylglucosamine transferase subunit ALG13
MIFLAVGTQFGFDRLIKTVDCAIEQKLIQDEVFAQIGPGFYLPKWMRYVVTLQKDEFDRIMNSCDAFVSHAGMGNIELAMKLQKPLLVLPRCKCFGEVVNDHQVDTARKFEQLGHILAAYDEKQLIEKIKYLKTFVPKLRTSNLQGVITKINSYLESISHEKQ